MSEVNTDAFKCIKLNECDLELMSRSDMQKLLVRFNHPATGTNLVLKGRIRTLILPHINSQSASTETETLQPVQVVSRENRTQPVANRAQNVSSTRTPTNTNISAVPDTISPPLATPSGSEAIRVTPGDAAKKAKTAPEKRLKRFRPNCTAKIYPRIERAKSQRLYLIQQDPVVKEDAQHYGGSSCTFHVLGSTGNVYDVVISKIPKCSCPDHQKGNLCKHILFVFMKVIGLDHQSNLIYQSALLQSELDHIFLSMEQTQKRRRTSIMARQAVQKAFKKRSLTDQEEVDDSPKRKDLSENDECAICFDIMNPQKETLTFCKSTCGTNFHKNCIDMWIRSKGRAEQICCPTCRQPWIGDQVSSNNKKDGDEGYLNMARLQGQSRERDTRTYSSWYGGWKRQRHFR